MNSLNSVISVYLPRSAVISYLVRDYYFWLVHVGIVLYILYDYYPAALT